MKILHTWPDRSCAAALETVSRHPARVAELLEQVLSIGAAESSDMVRQRFQNVQGLHEFI
ncbi:hypothetical protein HPB50_010302 [Hyalomma asiaticum]|uniref:Uncharacterized protein n=1 Tax=Hyalomma asiaticum TaxID=266040 RepID=A0ACB7THR4_HYAAI|nr:hypothetical protein HPB50_010302 [Hyalomma asiaticum]